MDENGTYHYSGGGNPGYTPTPPKRTPKSPI